MVAVNPHLLSFMTVPLRPNRSVPVAPSASPPEPPRLLSSPEQLIRQTEPVVAPLQPQEWHQLLTQSRYPLTSLYRLAHHTLATPETFPQRVAMFARLNQVLDPAHRGLLRALLENGNVLTDIRGDDRHSTLYHLYGILTTPRAPGLNPLTTTKETLRFLYAPDGNEQDFPYLSLGNFLLMRWAMEHPTFDAHQQQAPLLPSHWEAINFKDSRTCAGAAEMSRLASQNPKEFTRQINQATSAMGIVFEKATPFEINPSDPREAAQKLKAFNLDYFALKDGNFLVQLPVPRLGLIRAINAQQFPNSERGTGIEALYQTLYLYNAARKNYDPATDTRDSLDLTHVAIYHAPSLTGDQKDRLAKVLGEYARLDDIIPRITRPLAQWPNVSQEDRQTIVDSLYQRSYGLTEPERTLMERIVEDGEPFRSVTYQVSAGPGPHAAPEDRGKLYLYGYSRTFDDITADLIHGLQTGRQLIDGISFTAPDGELIGSHVIKINRYDTDPRTGRLYFSITDSDDQVKGERLVWATDLVPHLHRQGLPDSLAREVWTDIDSRPNQFFQPDLTDGQRYRVIPYHPGQPPQGTYLPGQYLQYRQQEKAQELEQQALRNPFILPDLPPSPHTL